MPESLAALVHAIDHELPQTQCGLCGHPGCLPYAKRIAEGEVFNKCIPGGQAVSDTLARLLTLPAIPVVSSPWPVQSDRRPQRLKAIIREDECIGCVKCIQACPVDAIIGTGKMMHQIVASLCTGCELCIPPCPVNCIDLVEDKVIPASPIQYQQQEDLRARYYARLARDGITALASNSNRIHIAPAPEIEEPFSVTLQVMHHLSPENMIKLAQLQVKLKKLRKQQQATHTSAMQKLEQEIGDLMQMGLNQPMRDINAQ